MRETVHIKTKKIKDVLLHADSDTLVVFDIDKTLLQAAHYVGSLLCEKHLKIDFQKKGFSEKEAVDKADAIWTNLQDVIPVKSVEPGTVDVITEFCH